MSGRIHWPGQHAKTLLTLEQVRAIGSASRSEVFWAYSPLLPFSVQEIAASIKKSPQSVRYHTNDLLAADLIYPVVLRKKRSRTEEAYVWRSVDFQTPKPPHAPEYLAEMIRGYRAIMRQRDRDREAVLHLINEVPEDHIFDLFWLTIARVTREDMVAIRKKIAKLSQEIEELDTPEGIRIMIYWGGAPNIGETRAMYQEVTGKPLSYDATRESES